MNIPLFSGDRRRCPVAGSHQLRAFTLVELLVVIAIIGTLVGLLLPAIQTAREAARLSQCGNNLKQYALGMQNYQDAQGVLPLGTSYWQCINVSWLPVLWPFIEQNDLASKFKYDQNYSGWPNSGAASQKLPLTIPLPLYYCPSDRPGLSWTDQWNNTIVRSNYATNGTSLVRSGVKYRGPFVTYFDGAKSDCTGSGWVTFEARGYKGKEATRFKNITDGLSKTLLMSEQNIPTSEEDSGLDDPRGQVHISYGFDTSRATPNSSFDIVPSWWVSPNYSCANLPPNLPCQATGAGNTFSLAARSKHRGGVQAAFCDGAVQFMLDNVDLSVWQAVGTISGAETLSP